MAHVARSSSKTDEPERAVTSKARATGSHLEAREVGRAASRVPFRSVRDRYSRAPSRRFRRACPSPPPSSPSPSSSRSSRFPARFRARPVEKTFRYRVRYLVRRYKMQEHPDYSVSSSSRRIAPSRAAKPCRRPRGGTALGPRMHRTTVTTARDFSTHVRSAATALRRADVYLYAAIPSINPESTR